MSFGLKNAGATYQRQVNEMFKEMIGKTMEVYIDEVHVRTEAALRYNKRQQGALCGRAPYL